MPEITVSIGGRSFRMACEPGEENNLHQAAELLDAEAETLQKAIGRLPEPRMLLMSGLMLADRMIELARQTQAIEEENQKLRRQVSQAGGARPGADEATRKAIRRLEDATARAEKLAGR
ncbi:cell division protein ZapA [Halovulum dunhuangense]|uniref:Cell division protein ZapA n=1 Tax=Halovulum dunhuangense TaxID=1505036 RepID=A0A849L608_9RHOB|nr:cell division protein ZapA [Halovulum dunhuangense]NNU81928.1 cell division protein ZapA [Halovulum dunhuangense]